jgi:hypothetical protein
MSPRRHKDQLLPLGWNSRMWMVPQLLHVWTLELIQKGILILRFLSESISIALPTFQPKIIPFSIQGDDTLQRNFGSLVLV